MKNTLRACLVAVALATLLHAGLGFSPASMSAQQQGAAGGQGPGGGGRAGGAQPEVRVPSVSKRPTGANLGTIRAGAQDNAIWFGWRVAMPISAIKGQTFSDV